jgi:hypothetical protein
MAIVWPCSLDVDTYAAAGRRVEAARPICPACGGSMIFWSGYWRFVRAGAPRRIWIPRSRCPPCGTSHGLIPAFALSGRLDTVEVIGPALARVMAGQRTAAVAAEAGLAYTTVRDWRRRHRGRAELILAGFAAMTIALGATSPRLSAVPERAAIEAMAATWIALQGRVGGRAPSLWRTVSMVSGGAWLGTTTNPPWTALAKGRLMPPVP